MNRCRCRYRIYSIRFILCIVCPFVILFFFFQAEDGIRDLVRSRGLGDVYKRQVIVESEMTSTIATTNVVCFGQSDGTAIVSTTGIGCLLYTSDAADDLLCVDLGGRRIIKKKKNQKINF